MPSVSKKQHNLMALVANNPKAAKRLKIPQSVGEDFMKADKGKKFAKGGMSKHEDVKLDKKIVKKAIGMHDKQMHGGKKTSLTSLKKGGKVKKYAGGGDVSATKKPAKPAESDYDKRLREDALAEMRDKKMREQMGKAYDKAKENSLGSPDKLRKGGCVKKYARGGGIEVRGKTRGRII